jgi:hypothetical protein
LPILKLQVLICTLYSQIKGTSTFSSCGFVSYGAFGLCGLLYMSSFWDMSMYGAEWIHFLNYQIYSSQAVQFVADLGFQYSLPPFLMVSDHYLLVFIPIIYKPSSTLSHHLLLGLPLFLVPSIVAVAFSCGIPSMWP